MRRAAWLARSAVAVMAAVLLLVSCSPPGSDPVEPEASGGGDAASVRFHLYQAPTTFDPFHATNGADGQIIGLQFRPLVKAVGEDFEPQLAESWTISDDARVYTFKLRDATWSDGQPFSVDDVIWTLETYADPETNSSYSGRLSLVEGFDEFRAGKADTISGISAPDDRTIVVTLSEPNAGWLVSASGVTMVPKHVYAELGRSNLQGAAEFREPPVGMGPYIFSRWVTDDQVEFIPNDRSYEPHPLGHVYAQYLAGDVARAQLETGEIDIAQLSSVDAAELKAAGTVNVQYDSGLGVMSLYTALDSGKLADVRVRQAILHAIDRQAIVDNVLAGNGRVVNSLLYTPSWAIADDLDEYAYDPDRARQLLAAADWDPDTVVNLDIVPGQADRDAVMDIVAGQLQAVGIKAKLHPVQPAELSKLVTDRKFDLLITILGISPGEPSAINERFMCAGTLNISKYCNKELDGLLERAVAIGAKEQRAPMYQEASRILNRDVPAMPLYLVNQAWGSNPRVHGFDPNRGGLGFAQEWTVDA